MVPFQSTLCVLSSFHRQTSLSYSFIDAVSSDTLMWRLNDLSMSVNNNPSFFDGDDFLQSFSYSSSSPSSINDMDKNSDSESFPTQSPSIYPSELIPDIETYDKSSKLSCFTEQMENLNATTNTFEVGFTIRLEAVQSIFISFSKAMTFVSFLLQKAGQSILACADEGDMLENWNDSIGLVVAINMTLPEVTKLGKTNIFRCQPLFIIFLKHLSLIQ